MDSKLVNEIVARIKTVERLLSDQSNDPLDVERAAKYLGLSKSALYKRTMSGTIPCHRLPGGKKLHFFRSELDEYIRNPDKFEKDRETRVATKVMRSNRKRRSKSSETKEGSKIALNKHNSKIKTEGR